MELRAYQTYCMRQIREKRLAGILRMILQSPTGSGKTVLAVALIIMALAQNKRILFVAHRIELLDQAIAKLIDWGVPETAIGVIRSGDPRVRPEAPVQVASIQSLTILPTVDLVIIDEAHRSASASYLKLFEAYTRAVIFGLTATPERLDGRPLTMYEVIIVVAQPQELALAGYIESPIVYTVPRELMPELEEVDYDSGDYNRKQLAVAVKQRRLIGSIVEHWKQRAEERTTIASCVDVEHSKQICKEFLAAGIPAEHADGKMAAKARKELIGRLRRRETLIVTQVDLWTEGVDEPCAKCGIMAKPTRSLTVYCQFGGRFLRPFQGIVPIILDHAGNYLLHGPLLENRIYRLDGRVKRPQGAAIATSCKYCNMGLPAGTKTCPDCKRPIAASSENARTIRTEDGFLIEAPPDETTIRRNFWQQKLRDASKLGYKIEWCKHAFKERFGEWPPPSWSVIPPRETKPADDATRRAQLNKLRGMSYRNKLGDPWVRERYYAMYQDTPEGLLQRETAARSVPQAETITKVLPPNEEFEI